MSGARKTVSNHAEHKKFQQLDILAFTETVVYYLWIKVRNYEHY